MLFRSGLYYQAPFFKELRDTSTVNGITIASLNENNHACVGDPLYGKCDARADQGLTRQFLHSWRVAFDHPVTGERIECRDELPWDLAAVLDDLAPRSLGRTAAGDEIVPQLGLLEA